MNCFAGQHLDLAEDVIEDLNYTHDDTVDRPLTIEYQPSAEEALFCISMPLKTETGEPVGW